MAISPDGRVAVSGSWDDTLRVWDIATESARRSWKGILGLSRRLPYPLMGEWLSRGHRIIRFGMVSGQWKEHINAAWAHYDGSGDIP